MNDLTVSNLLDWLAVLGYISFAVFIAWQVITR